MPIQANDEYHDKRKTEDQHGPIDEAMESGWIKLSPACTTPIIKISASHRAHQRRTEHATISHAGQHSSDDNGPKGSRHDRLFCTHAAPPQVIIIKTHPANRLDNLKRNQLSCYYLIHHQQSFSLGFLAQLLLCIKFSLQFHINAKTNRIPNLNYVPLPLSRELPAYFILFFTESLTRTKLLLISVT
jgi:hypothetical protein